MVKPTRKASTLQSGGMFSKPAPEAAPAVEVTEPPAPAPKAKAVPKAKAAPAVARAVEGTSETRSKKVAYYVTGDEGERIRAAFMAGRDRYGWRSFSEFQLSTLLEKAAELENELNDGKPFEGVAPGRATRGRPFDS